MAKNATIGLCYFFDNNTNSGIVNYIYNIIAALNALESTDKPNIVVFHSANAPVDYLKNIQYPSIQFVLYRDHSPVIVVRKINSLIKRIFKTDLYKQVNYYWKVDSLYPYFDFADFGFKEAKNKIHWLVDFNNHAFPEYYNSEDLVMMDNHQRRITAQPGRIVLSSYALLQELKKYYPDYKCDVKILRFASSLPVLKTESIAQLLKKHQINVQYFMSPNQFWEHKNQGVVLDALNIIKTQYPDLSFKVMFTGSLTVNRGKGLYADKLKKKIEDFRLESYIQFLGVVERNEQLMLMKHSLALLQPSLYEGWSTLVEEAKALNKFIILSDLPVHREQIDINVDFFDPFDAADLAKKMLTQLHEPPAPVPVDYSVNVKEFGTAVLDALTFS